MNSTFNSRNILDIFTCVSNYPYVIAEIGVNHDGSIDKAKKLIEVAKNSGADAVKFQTFITEEVVSSHAPLADYQRKNTNDSSQFEMIKKLELGIESFQELKKFADDLRIPFFSTGFDLKSCQNVNNLGVKFHKIPSGEITNGPLIYEIAKFNKPIILSTGMSNLAEIHQALFVISQGFLGNSPDVFKDKIPLSKQYYEETLKIIENRVAIMHCTSDYPVKSKEVNISSIVSLEKEFKLQIGFSDHTIDSVGAIMALAFGSRFFEKHITLNKSSLGPDHSSSCDPEELKKYIKKLKYAFEVLGNRIKNPTPSEIGTKKVARKSLIAISKINKGDQFSDKNLGIKRPGTGINPMNYWEYVNKKNAGRDFNQDDLIC